MRVWIEGHIDVESCAEYDEYMNDLWSLGFVVQLVEDHELACDPEEDNE